jgi:Protein of unknown function (DUF3455)
LRERTFVLKNWNRILNQAARRIMPTACATALSVAFAVSLPARADKVTPPPVPANLQVEAGSHAFLVGHAIGTQNYVCAPSANGVAYVLFTPEATLYNDDGKQLITHFFSPNPDPSDPNTSAAVVADGAIRATWVDSRDGSSVWAKLHTNAQGVNGSFTPDPTAVAWLLLDKVGVEDGLAGGNILSKTTQVQRLNTTGGVAPGHGCDSPADVGHTAFQDYTADYFFYTNR